MAINDVLGLTVDVSATTDGFVKALQQAAQRANLDLNVADPLIKSFKSAQSNIKGIFAQTVAAGAEAGLNKTQLGGFVKKLQPLTDNIEDSMKRIFKMEMATRREGLSDAKKEQVRTLLEMERSKLKGLETRLKIEKRGADGIIERRKAVVLEAEKLAARTMAEAGEEFGESISSAFEDIKSGNLSNIFKGLGKGAGARGEVLKEKGLAAGGAKGELLQGLGGILKTLGPVLLMVGALVAGIAAVGKMILDADAKAKELNRTLLDSGVAMGELTDSFGEGSENLSKLVNTFSNAEGAFAFNRLWGTTAKDHLEIIGAYAKAGVTFKELKNSTAAAGTEMERLQNATAAALTYARLLGSTNTEMAEIFATKMEEMGQTIDGVSKSLSAVHMAAQESGFGVKRFFNMVLQATTGMSMYNVRMEEAAGLLTRLGKILGPKAGGEFLQNLTKGFVDESTQQKYRRVKMAGEGVTQGTFQRSADDTARAFLDKVDAAGGAGLRKALADANIKLDLSSTKGLMKSIQGMDQDQQQKALAAASQAGNDDLVLQLRNTMGVVQGAKGGTGNMAMQLGSLDMGGKLMMLLNSTRSFIGADISKMDLTQTMAFENSTGIQGEQLAQLKLLDGRLRGNYDLLKDQAKSGKVLSAQEEVTQAKEFGAITRGNQVLAAKWDATNKRLRIGEEIKSFESYTQSQGDVLTKFAADSLASDIKLAQEQVAATTEMSRILEQGVEALLMDINDAVQALANWFTGGLDDKERVLQKDLFSGLTLEIRELQKDERAAGKEYDKAASRLSTAAEPDKAKIQAEMDAAQAKQKALRGQMVEKQALATKIKGMKHGAGWFSSMTADEMTKKGREGLSAEDRLKAMGSLGMASGDQEDLKQKTARAKQATLDRYLKEYGAKDEADLQTKIAATRDEAPGRLSMMSENYGAPSREEQAQQVMDQIRKEMAAAGDAASKPEAAPDWFDPVKLAEEEIKKQKQLLTQKGAQSPAGVNAEAIGTKMEEVNLSTDAKNRQALKEDQIQNQLQGIMGAAGVVDPDMASMLSGWSKEMAAQGGVPQSLQKFLEANPAAQQGFKASGLGLAGPAAEDFIMQVGEGGRVKFAQRIDGGDTVTATKSGGAIDTATRGGGGGGVTIIQHNYSGTEAIQKGYRALAAAKAI